MPKKIVAERFCVSQNLWYRIILRIGEKGGEKEGITTFCQMCFSHRIENFRRGTLLCFTKSLVSKKFMDGKVGGEEDGVTRFSVDSFCLTVAKNFVGELFTVSLVSGIEKLNA